MIPVILSQHPTAVETINTINTYFCSIKVKKKVRESLLTPGRRRFSRGSGKLYVAFLNRQGGLAYSLPPPNESDPTYRAGKRDTFRRYIASATGWLRHNTWYGIFSSVIHGARRYHYSPYGVRRSKNCLVVCIGIGTRPAIVLL